MENPKFLTEHGFLDPQIGTWITDCRQRFSKWFSLAENTNKLGLQVLFQLDAHNHVIHELLLASLYLRTLHNYQGTLLMIERGMVTQGRVLARAMLDSVFPLVAIAKDHSFAETYAHNHLLQQVKYLEKAKKLTSARIPEIDDPKSSARAEELRSEIKRHGVKEIKTEQLAQRAGLTEWYLTAYALLSGTVHSRAGDLEEYLVMNPEGEIKEFDWGPRTKGLKTLMLSAIETMLVSIEHVQAISADWSAKPLNDMRETLKELYANEFLKVT